MMDSPWKLSPTLSQSIVVLLRHGGETSWPMRPNQWGCCFRWLSADFACFQKLNLHNIQKLPSCKDCEGMCLWRSPCILCTYVHITSQCYISIYICIDSYGSTPTILYHYVGNFHLLCAVQDTRVLTIWTHSHIPFGSVWWFDVHWTAIPLQNWANHDKLVAQGSIRICIGTWTTC